MTLLIDNDHECTLDEFINVNIVAPDVYHISETSLEAVLKLQPGESTHVNLSEIKRID